MKKRKSRKSKKNIFYKIISILLALSSICFLSLLFYIDLLPTKYLIVTLIIVLLFTGLNICLINIRHLKKKIKKTISIFMLIAILVLFTANFYICKTLGVLSNNGDSKYKLEHFSVIVLKDSGYDKLKDIKGEEIGYFINSTGSEVANKELKKKVDVSFNSYKNSNALLNDLLESKINAILIEDSIKNIMEEELTEFSNLTKILYSFTIKTKVETTLKEVKVTKEPFAVYISGIDTYGKISSVSRSDVNMVMVVNPNIQQVLLISIPRDYYVQLHGITGTKDKLTHAGIYGIDMSIQTIEDLLKLDINYYLKVNFTSAIDIVDALGGLDVYSEYTFTSYSGFRFKKGMNFVNGEQALDFARTRKAFADGDRQRGKNQQAVIEAIIRKATSKSIITKYNSLLNAINGKYQTNMSINNITNLLKMQLKDMPSWNVTSYSLTGKDGKNYTYTYNQLLYVMNPNPESVDEAINLIDSVFNGQRLETSYNNLGGSSNKVIQVPITNKFDSDKNKEGKQQRENDFNNSDSLDNKANNKEENNNKKNEDQKEEQGNEESYIDENGDNSLDDLLSGDDDNKDLEKDNLDEEITSPIIPSE